MTRIQKKDNFFNIKETFLCYVCVTFMHICLSTFCYLSSNQATICRLYCNTKPIVVIQYSERKQMHRTLFVYLSMVISFRQPQSQEFRTNIGRYFIKILTIHYLSANGSVCKCSSAGMNAFTPRTCWRTKELILIPRCSTTGCQIISQP